MFVAYIIYIVLWKRTIRELNLSFKKGIEYLQKLLNNKKLDPSILDSIEYEIKQFIDLLINIINKLNVSEQNLKRTTDKLNVIRQEERKQIAQHLHDYLGQNITALKLENKILESQLNNVDKKSKRTFERINYIQEDSIEIIKQITHNLRIPEIKEIGVIAAIKKLIKYRNELNLTYFTLISENEEFLLDSSKNLVIYQCVFEGINNILKHAKAKKSEIIIKPTKDTISLYIKDNGMGIPDGMAYSMGLNGMKEAAERVNGTFNIISKLNKGTTVFIKLPNQTLVLRK